MIERKTSTDLEKKNLKANTKHWNKQTKKRIPSLEVFKRLCLHMLCVPIKLTSKLMDFLWFPPPSPAEGGQVAGSLAGFKSSSSSSSGGQTREHKTTKIRPKTTDPVGESQGAGPDQETVVTPSAVGRNSPRLQSAINRLLFKAFTCGHSP